MPRFPVTFSRRKSSVENVENAPLAPSFRVLDRSELPSGSRSPDSEHLAVRRPAKSRTMPATLSEGMAIGDDTSFDDLKNNRGSGSSKTTTADNSSRHSNASTTPSSADYNAQQQPPQPPQHSQLNEEYRRPGSSAYNDIPVPPIPKSNTTSSFLKSAGRTFSFGGQKKHERSPVSTPPGTGRERAATASTATATPPKLEEEFTLDLGGDFSKMLGNFDKRASVMTVHEEGQAQGQVQGQGRPALAPRSLSGNRLNQPSPIHLDATSKVEPSPLSWGSQHSNERLIQPSPFGRSPTNENAPPVPRHAAQYINTSERSPNPSTATPVDSGLRRSSAKFGRRRSTTMDYVPEPEDEDSVLLRDSYSTANRFLGGDSTPAAVPKTSPVPIASRFKRNDESAYRQLPTTESTSPIEPKVPVEEEENMFDTSFSRAREIVPRPVIRKPSPQPNKVMTPAEFERYRKDKEFQERRKSVVMMKPDEAAGDDDEDNYDDEFEDEADKARRVAKERRKQEAHMTVYRQQMMKVTGESASGTLARPGLSASSPNLSTFTGINSGPSPQGGSDVSDDEEVPLAILAAHGFPNKNRPPTRLSNMMSNPNLRAAATPSYQRPSSAMGATQGGGGNLPPFARNLPQDPYGLVSPPVRETLQFSGGVPAGAPTPMMMPRSNSPQLPPGGLIGVIASEERSRAIRRGAGHTLPGGHFEQSFMQPPALTPGDQAQIQMTQQMQQFMQMQMQFMQLVASNNAQPRPESHYSTTSGFNPMMSGGMGMGMGAPSMAGPDMSRATFMDNGSMADLSGQQRLDMRNGRTMSMVQPGNASWVQPRAPNAGMAPSIRLIGNNGYAASIAPSERNNIGLPGRYRPVSHLQMGSESDLHNSVAMSGALGAGVSNALASEGSTPDAAASTSPNWDQSRKQTNRSPLNNTLTAVDDDDDEVGWAAMKAKREKKRSLWKSKKTLDSELSTLIV